MVQRYSGVTGGVRWNTEVRSDGAKTVMNGKTYETRVRGGTTYASDGNGNWFKFDGKKYVPSSRP